MRLNIVVLRLTPMDPRLLKFLIVIKEIILLIYKHLIVLVLTKIIININFRVVSWGTICFVISERCIHILLIFLLFCLQVLRSTAAKLFVIIWLKIAFKRYLWAKLWLLTIWTLLFKYYLLSSILGIARHWYRLVSLVFVISFVK